MSKPTKHKYTYRASDGRSFGESARDHYLSFLSSLDQSATADQVLSYHRSYLQTQDLSEQDQINLLLSMESHYYRVLDSKEAKSRLTSMIFSGVCAAILLPLGIVFLLATPGTQPVAAVAAAFVIAFGASAAIICFITAVNYFKYRQTPLDASHMSAISSLIKERGAISNNQATPDHHKHAEQTSSSEFDYRESRSLLDPHSVDQSHAGAHEEGSEAKDDREPGTDDREENPSVRKVK